MGCTKDFISWFYNRYEAYICYLEEKINLPLKETGLKGDEEGKETVEPLANTPALLERGK